MSKNPTVEDAINMANCHGMDINVTAKDAPMVVLYRLIEAQAQQITELRADLKRLADLSGLGDFL